jgi:hypothetical protein
VSRRSCDTCLFEKLSVDQDPCCDCAIGGEDNWQPKPIVYKGDVSLSLEKILKLLRRIAAAKSAGERDTICADIDDLLEEVEDDRHRTRTIHSRNSQR